MDELFRDIENESIDSNGFEPHAESTPKRKRLSRTKITAYLSPIASNNTSHSDDTSMHDDNENSKSLNESSLIEKSYQSDAFSPKWNSTPKARRTKGRSRSRSNNEIKGFKSRKQSKEQPNITLWDRAMTKNVRFNIIIFNIYIY